MTTPTRDRFAEAVRATLTARHAPRHPLGRSVDARPVERRLAPHAPIHPVNPNQEVK